MHKQRLVVAGAASWVVAVAALRPPLEVAILLAGPLVAVPLALGLLEGRGRYRVARALCVPAALPLLVSFWLDAGPAAALWAFPWALFALWIALLGVLRLVEDGGRPASEVAVGAGHVFLAVGGAWLVISRWGQPVLGFGDPIAFLTAAHFHFAGFALPVLAGLAGRRLPGRTSAAATLAIVAGIPILATGITFAPQGIDWVEPVGVAVVAAGAVLTAIQQSRLSLRPGPVAARAAWVVSAISLLAGISLALHYGIGRHIGVAPLSLDAMVRTHAILNAFGFSILGLAAWHLAGAPPRPPHLAILLPGEEAQVRDGIDGPAPPHPRSRRDDEDSCTARLALEPPGPPLPDGPYRRVASAIMAYDMFPSHVLRRVHAPVRAAPGDLVAATHRLLGLRLLMEAGVVAVFDGTDQDGRWHAGFTYRTLAGHPETGDETFAVRKDPVTGDVELEITAWSRPGHPAVRLLRPWARRRQHAAVAAAIAHLRARAAGDPSGPIGDASGRATSRNP